MRIWLHRDSTGEDAESAVLMFEEPEDPENWFRFSSQEEYYGDVATRLEKLAAKYEAAGDDLRRDIAVALAHDLRRELPPNDLCH